MSSRKRAIIPVTILLFGLAILVGVALLFLWRGDEARLNLARKEVQLMFSATTPAARGQHAHDCLRLARPLAGKTGRIGSTATLFHLGAAPLANLDAAKFPVPLENQLQEISTEDLLLGCRLMFNTQRVGLADQLIELLLSRDDADREEILRLAITVRYELGRDDDVLVHCDEVIAMHADDPRLYHVKAMVHRNHGRWEYFIDAAEKGIALLKKGGDVPEIDVVELIDGYLHLGQTANARREFDARSGRQSDPISDESILHARLLIQEGEQVQAAAILDNVLATRPGDAEALILKGTLLVGQGQYDEAISVLQTAVEVAPTAEQAYYQLGQAHARRGDQDHARDFLEKHRRLLNAKVRLYQLEQRAVQEPHNVNVRMELAEKYAQIGLTALAEFWTRAARAAAE